MSDLSLINRITNEIVKEFEIKLQERFNTSNIILSFVQTNDTEYKLAAMYSGLEIAFITFRDLFINNFRCVFIESSRTEPKARGFNLNPILKCILIKICIRYGNFSFIFTESLSPVTAKINMDLGFVDISNNPFCSRKGKKLIESMYENKDNSKYEIYTYFVEPAIFNDGGEFVEKNFSHMLVLLDEELMEKTDATCITKFIRKGGNSEYYTKYLKYKIKYLQLKDKLAKLS